MAVVAELTIQAAPVMDQVHLLARIYQQAAAMEVTEIINTQEASVVAVQEAI